MARHALSSPQIFFLLILFRAFSLIEAAPMQNREYKFPTSSGKSKYTFELVSSDEYQIPTPSFDAAADSLNFQVIGPPGEIVLYVRRTDISWDGRTIYTDSFIGQPKIRGTISILLSCVLTLFLCVWTAFHANIEPVEDENKGDSWIDKRRHDTTNGNGGWCQKTLWSVIAKGYSWIRKCLHNLIHGSWRRKALWSVIIIIFPESAFFFALFERKAAKLICKLIDKALKDNGGSESNTRSGDPDRNGWSSKRQLGYLALMGGFAIRNSDGELKTLTPEGVYFVCLHLKPADKLAKVVDDKNGASGLAKCLVVFQVIWIIIQIICRYKAGLSVTLLETHTVIHAVCALMTYITWFKKPFGVKHPIELELPRPTTTIPDEQKQKFAEVIKMIFDEREGEPHPINLFNIHNQETPLMPLSLDSTDYRPTRTLLQETSLMPLPLKLMDSTDYRPTRALLSTKRAGQTRLASRVLSGGASRCLSNLPSFILAVRQNLGLIWQVCLIISAANMFYGGLHVWALLAGHFPTPQEKFLWLLALCFIAVGGIVWFIYFISFRISTSDSGQVRDRPVIKWLFMAICLVTSFLSVVARLYLVGESFASLRDPSAKAFRMVSWTNLAVF